MTVIPIYDVIDDNSDIKPLSNVYSNNGRESRGSTVGNFAPGTGGKTEWGRRRFASHGVNLWNGLLKDTKAISK